MENINELIPKEIYREEKQKHKLYKSKYPSTIEPTASTFITHTTSFPGVKYYSFNF